MTNNIEKSNVITAIKRLYDNLNNDAAKSQSLINALIREYEEKLIKVVNQRDKLNNDIKELNKRIDNDTSIIAEKDKIIAGLQARITELAHEEQMGHHNVKQEFIPEFKPFDRVIVSLDNECWFNDIFLNCYLNKNNNKVYRTCTGHYKYCKHYIESE